MHIELAPFEKRIVNISEAFGDAVQDGAERSILRIESSRPISGMYAYAALEGDTAAYPLLEEKSLQQELVLPHAAYNRGRWWTGVGVFNPNSHPVSVFAQPFNQDGAAMNAGGAFIDLAAGAYEVFAVHEKFSGPADDIAYIRFAADDPEDAPIGGFYLYGNTPGQDAGARKRLSGGRM